MASRMSSGSMPGVEPPARRQRGAGQMTASPPSRWPSPGTRPAARGRGGAAGAPPRTVRARPRRRRGARRRAERRPARPGPAPCPGVRAERRRPRARRSQPVDRAGRARGETRAHEERQQHQPPAASRCRPSHAERRRRHQHRDQGRRDCMREEILDHLDVLGGHADQVAGAPPHQIGRRQRSSFAKSAMRISASSR